MRTKELIITWSIVSSILITLFWTISYNFYGNVPLITNVKIFEGSAFSLTYNLPFSISHWWDILIGPIFSSAIVFFLTKTEKKKIYFLYFSLTICLTIVFGLGLGVGIIFGLFIGKKYFIWLFQINKCVSETTTHILTTGLTSSIIFWVWSTVMTAGFFGLNFSSGIFLGLNLTFILIILIEYINTINLSNKILVT